MHDHQQYMEPLWFELLDAYLRRQLLTGVLPQGEEIYAVRYVPNNEVIRGSGKCLVERKDGRIIEGPALQGEIARQVILAQYNELFAEFFAAAAAGPSYWTTIRDFELKGDPEAWTKWESQWDTKRRHLFEPHPPPSIRATVLPSLFLDALETCLMGGTDEARKAVVDRMNSDLQAAAMPIVPGDTLISFVCDRVESDARCIVLPLAFLVPFYEAAFEAMRVLMMKWWNANHPLALIPAIFFSVHHHSAIELLAQEFRTSVPKFYDEHLVLSHGRRVAGAAAARLCYDRHGLEILEALQARARTYLDDAVKLGLVDIVTQPTTETGT